MAADAEVTREELHLRRIDMRGYRRSDGLYEIEGRVLDQKSHDFSVPGDEGTVAAGQPIHDMGVRLVFDENLLVHDVHTFTSTAPYAECPSGGRLFDSLKGLRIEGGWRREVRNRLAASQSCTHLVELLAPMATVAFQTMAGVRQHGPERFDATGRPAKIDSCYAYRAQGDIVLRRWPAWSPRASQSKA